MDIFGDVELPEYYRTTEETPMETQDTSFTYDTNTQYNTDDTNLETNDTFSEPGPMPPGLEQAAEDILYTELSVLLDEQIEGTKWDYTLTGVKKLAERIYKYKNRFYFKLDDAPIRDVDNNAELVYPYLLDPSNQDPRLKNIDKSKLFNIVRLSKSTNELLAPSTVENYYGREFRDYIQKILDTRGPPQEPATAPPMDDQPSTRQIQPQQISPETQKFIDDLLKGEKPIKKLLDATEEQLIDFGCNELFLREWRTVVAESIDLAKLQAQYLTKIVELENKNEQLEQKVKNVARDYIKSVEEDLGEKDELKKQLDKVKEEKAASDEELKSLRKKDWEASIAQETGGKRLKRLFLDIVKNNSNLPLKDRLQILFKFEGVTIGSIITSVVMTLSTIGLAIGLALGLTGKSAVPPPKPKPPKPKPEPPKPKPKPDPPKPDPTPKPDPPKPDPTPKPEPEPPATNPVKEGLKKFAQWLAELAKKSLAALPGIIGKIVSFILKSIGAAVGFLAEHMIILVIIIVSSIVYGLVEGVRYIKKSGK